MKKLFSILIGLFIGLVVLVLLLFAISFYGDSQREEVIQAHLKEINTCIQRHKNDKEYIDIEDIKDDCTDAFLFLYDNTREKTDYNTLAEKLKYKYVTYAGRDNKKLIEEMIKVYPSIKENITGLDEQKK